MTEDEGSFKLPEWKPTENTLFIILCVLASIIMILGGFLIHEFISMEKQCNKFCDERIDKISQFCPQLNATIGLKTDKYINFGINKTI